MIELYFIRNLDTLSPASGSYFAFFPPIAIVGLPERELAVAETFGFSFFGFLVSLLVFLPLAIVCPSKLQRSSAKLTKGDCRIHHFPIKGARWIFFSTYVECCCFSLASSSTRCCPRDTVIIGDLNIAFAAAKSSPVSISVQFKPVMSIA